MQNFKNFAIVLGVLLAVGSSCARRSYSQGGGYRCPDNVSEEECNSYQCNKNAELVECINFCNTCELAKVCIDYCAPGCDCKAGFLRDTTGACIPKKSCKRSVPTKS